MAQNDQIIKAFELQEFFPYQVRVFYRAVSESIADIYTMKYNLTVFEWRVMAVLGNNQPLTASEIVAHSSLDKVQISRAIKGLTNANLLERKTDRTDKRRVNLMLTAKGNKIFHELVPLVQNRKNKILAGLSDGEIYILKDLMARIQNNAENCIKINNNINMDQL